MRRFLPLAIALSLFATANASAAADRVGSAGPSGSCWHMATPLPHDLMGGAPASDGTYAYVVGGFSLGSTETLDKAFRYAFTSDTWTTLARSGLIAHQLYVVGGRDAANATLNSTWAYHIGTDT